MKSKIALLLLLGAITTTEAVLLQKPAEKHTISLAQHNPNSNHTKEAKPKEHAKVMVDESQKAEKLVVSIDANNKDGKPVDKAHELAAMEEALKQAQEEAHK